MRDSGAVDVRRVVQMDRQSIRNGTCEVKDQVTIFDRLHPIELTDWAALLTEERCVRAIPYEEMLHVRHEAGNGACMTFVNFPHWPHAVAEHEGGHAGWVADVL